jgi:hypothetical protein
MWAYLNFMIMIRNQDKDEDDGLESHVRQCIEQRSIDWFPTIRDDRSEDRWGKADALDKGFQLIAKLMRKSADELRQEVREEMRQLEVRMLHAVNPGRAATSISIPVEGPPISLVEALKNQ